MLSGLGSFANIEHPPSPHPQDVSHSNTSLSLHNQCKWIQHWKDGLSDRERKYNREDPRRSKEGRFPNHWVGAEGKMGRTG